MADLSFFTLIAPALFGPSLGGLLDADSTTPQQRQAYELVQCAQQLGQGQGGAYLQAATRLSSPAFVQEAIKDVQYREQNAQMRASPGQPAAPRQTDPRVLYQCQRLLLAVPPGQR